jgi:hypothetical protein
LLATAEHEASGGKGPAVAGSTSTQARMKIERRASLETGNVTAEPVRNRRRPPSAWEASSESTEQEHRGIGAGMWAKEGSVNTGSSRRRGERPQPEAREGQTGLPWVAERPVVALKRVMIVERRGLSSESERKCVECGRLTRGPRGRRRLTYPDRALGNAELLYAAAKAVGYEPGCCGRTARYSVRKPDAGNPHVRFDERDLETETWRISQTPATERVGNVL